MDPFLSAICEGPAMVSFSGGRTSALMLRRCLDAGLSARIGRGDVHILFANTGKERPETLDFVDEVDRRWCRPVGLSVRWLERERAIGPVRDHAARAEGRENGVTTFREVTYETAARAGEPFSQLIAERKFTPNPVARFCTQELKIRVMKAFMLSLGYEHWVNIVGMRADEPHRVSRLRAGEGRDGWSHAFPLHDAGITKMTSWSFGRGRSSTSGSARGRATATPVFLKASPSAPESSRTGRTWRSGGLSRRQRQLHSGSTVRPTARSPTLRALRGGCSTTRSSETARRRKMTRQISATACATTDPSRFRDFKPGSTVRNQSHEARNAARRRLVTNFSSKPRIN